MCQLSFNHPTIQKIFSTVTPIKKFNPYAKTSTTITPEKKTMMSDISPDDAKLMKVKEDALLAGDDHITHTATEFTKQDFEEHVKHYGELSMDDLTDVMFIGSGISKDLANTCYMNMLDVKKFLPDVRGAKLVYFMSSIRSTCEVVDETSEYIYNSDGSDDEDDDTAKSPGDGRGSGRVGIAAAWGDMTPTNLKAYLKLQGITSPSRITSLFTRDENGKFEASRDPQTLPLILIPRSGGKYSNKNYVDQVEFPTFGRLKRYNRNFWYNHVQSRTTKQGKPPVSHMELGAEYCFDMLNSDLIKKEGDALANMTCFNVGDRGGGNICGSLTPILILILIGEEVDDDDVITYIY